MGTNEWQLEPEIIKEGKAINAVKNIGNIN